MASKSFDPSTSYIEGLTPLSEICDDFVCKSSPAVEGSLRQIATDICAVRESKRSQEPYAPDVAFDDGSRRFVGFDGFATHTFIKDTIGNPKCAVTKMKMDANDSATLEWRLVGTGPTGSSVEINVVATLRMNLITGRVIAHTEVWDFGKVDGIAGALLQTQRNAFAAPKNLSDGVSEIAKSIEDAIGSVDLSDDDEVFADPNDPMKFFTETNKPSDDYLNYALFVAALWLVYEGLKATQTL